LKLDSLNELSLFAGGEQFVDSFLQEIGVYFTHELNNILDLIKK
jgi:hypothetical protein